MTATPPAITPTAFDHASMVAMAVWHAERLGCGVIPLWGTDDSGVCRCPAGASCRNKPGKHPHGPTAPAGVKDATYDPMKIRRMLKGRGAYGLTPPAGVVLLDLDGRAADAWADLADDLGPAPRSWGQRTRLGRHEGYLWPATGPADPGGNLAGIVTRRFGEGYVVGPGSVIAGHVYTPDTDSDGAPLPFAELPTTYAAALLAAAAPNHSATPQASQQAVASDCLACHPLAASVTGSRYDAILKLTLRLHAKGHSSDVKWQHVRDHLAPRFADPLTEAEVRQRFERAIADPGRMDAQAQQLLGNGGDTSIIEPWPEPEDRGVASKSAFGAIEYVADIVRPGRILGWAAEEGSGKSFAMAELALRVAAAGGLFAGTWPVLEGGPVLYLSEMHGDDDFDREATVLSSLGIKRADLTERLWRLPLMTAAGGVPVLTSDAWCAWIARWMRDRGIVLAIFDTATTASQVDPWGKDIQRVLGRLHGMQEAHPALAIILVVHVKKPRGAGARQISDVLGEWGRWSDVVVLQENEGHGLERTRLTARKRVRREMRIIATKAGGLLVDPAEVVIGNTMKVSPEVVAQAVAEKPGLTIAQLADAIGVSKDTAARYIKAMPDRLEARRGDRGSLAIYTIAAAPHAAASSGAVDDRDGDRGRRTAARTYRSAAAAAAITDEGFGADADPS